MKKTYLTPQLDVVKIQTVGMLAASDPSQLFLGIDGTTNTDWADSREMDMELESLEDDDEEEF